MTAPQITRIDNAWVVDYGLTWFRINDDGSFVKRVASPRGVKSPKIKNEEEALIRKILANHLSGLITAAQFDDINRRAV